MTKDFYCESLLCHLVKFRYLRLPYGLMCSPKFFQRFMHELLDGIPGLITYFNHILIYGFSLEDHNKNIQQSGLLYFLKTVSFFSGK